MKKAAIGRTLSIRSKSGRTQALHVLRRGGVVVFPTDTVYGIGCDAFNTHALARLARMKGRQKGKPFPILASDLAMVKHIAKIPVWLEPLPRMLWPGPWTFIVPARKKLSRFISRRGTVAVRVPCHNELLLVIKKFGRPIVGTSANRAGKEPVRTARAVQRAFAAAPSKPDLVLDGGALRGRPSVVIDASGRTLRILRS